MQINLFQITYNVEFYFEVLELMDFSDFILNKHKPAETQPISNDPY